MTGRNTVVYVDGLWYDKRQVIELIAIVSKRLDESNGDLPVNVKYQLLIEELYTEYSISQQILEDMHLFGYIKTAVGA